MQNEARCHIGMTAEQGPAAAACWGHPVFLQEYRPEEIPPTRRIGGSNEMQLHPLLVRLTGDPADQLLRNACAMERYLLPFACLFHEHARDLVMPADVLSLVSALHISSVRSNGGITVDANFHITCFN